MWNLITKTLFRITAKTGILKQGRKIPLQVNSIQSASAKPLASAMYDNKLLNTYNQGKQSNLKVNVQKYNKSSTSSLYARIVEDNEEILSSIYSLGSNKSTKIHKDAPDYKTFYQGIRRQERIDQEAKNIKNMFQAVKEAREKVAKIPVDDKKIKDFNKKYSHNGDEMESVALGLNASFILWGIYEPISYNKNFGNLTLKFRSINLRNGAKISSSTNPGLIYKWGIGQKQAPIPYWMWEEVVKSAHGGTTFWSLFWHKVKNLPTTRKEYYKQNKVKMLQDQKLINQKVGSKKFNKAQERRKNAK